MESYAKIYFVDFGNSALIGLADLLELPRQFQKLPFMAHHCALDLKDATKGSLAVIEEFFQLTEDRDLDIEILAIKNDKYTVDLKRCNQSISELLSRKFPSQTSDDSWSEKIHFKHDALHIATLKSSLNGAPLSWYCGHNKKVILTAYNDQDLWCMEESDIKKKLKLDSQMNNYFSQIILEKVKIEKNKMYAVKINQFWKRVIVLNTDTTSKDILVQCVDSGKNNVVSSESLQVIEERFKSFPISTKRICLYNRGVVYNMRIVEHILNKFISSETRIDLRVMGHNNGIPQVTLKVKGLDIVEDILAAPQAVYPLTQLIDRYKDIEIDCSLPTNLKERFSGRISHIETVHEFYVQPEEWNDDLHKLHAALNRIYSLQDKFLNLNRAEIGTFCIVKLSEDNCYYRAKIISGGSLKATIQLIDFGNYNEVQISDLFVLVDDIAIRSLCIKCALNDVNKLASLKKFQDITKNKLLICEYYEGSDCFILDLFDDTLNVNHELSDHNLISDEEVSALKVEPCCYSVECDTEKKKMTLLHVDNPEVFYTLPKQREQDRHILRTAMKEIYGEHISHLSNPSEGKFCAVKIFSEGLDGSWFRGKILEVRNDKSRVRLLDEGRVFICDNDKIKILIPSFMTKPACALECLLAEANEQKRNWTSHEKQSLMSGFPKRLETVFVVCKNIINHQMRVDLYDSKLGKVIIGEKKSASSDQFRFPEVLGTKTGLEMKSLVSSLEIGNCSSQQFLLKYLILKFTNINTGNEGDAQVNCFKIVSDKIIPAHQMITGEVEVMISSVKSPTEFWLQLKSEHDQLMKLVKEINSIQDKFDRLERARVNSYCLAKSTSLSSWQRAKILVVNSENVEVFMVDHGFKENVHVSDLREISSFLSQIPAFALQATLLSIQEPAKGWEDNQTQYFQKKIARKPAICRVLNITFPLEIILAVDNDVLNIEYVKAGFSCENIASGYLKGEITHISRSGDVYIQLDKDFKDIKHVESLMEKAHTFRDPSKLSMNDTVAVKKFQKWHRGLIKKIGSLNSVFLVDTGESILVENGFIKELPSYLIKINPLAHCFEKYLSLDFRLVFDQILSLRKVKVRESDKKLFMEGTELLDYVQTIEENGSNI